MDGISSFVVRFREAMDDPAYSSGVDPSSVVDTLEDIRRVYMGLTAYVRLPKPMDRIAPIDTMKFNVASDMIVNPLFSSDDSAVSTCVSRRALVRRNTIADSPSHADSKFVKPNDMMVMDEYAQEDGSQVAPDDIEDVIESLRHATMRKNESNSDDVIIVDAIPAPRAIRRATNRHRIAGESTGRVSFHD